jgi:drug/metabolite transporter (DMT)-like permease
MSLLSLTLVVLAAFIHATWNLLSKRAADAGPTFVFAYNMFACLVYLPWMIWLLIYGDLHWRLPVAGCLVLSACIHLAYSLCLQRGYQVADLSVVYPIARGTGPLLSSIGAFILLRETPTAQGIFGLLAVVAGIGLITTQGDLSAFRRPRGLDGVRWGTATGSLSNVPRAREKMKGYWWLAFGVGALSPLSYILVLSAIQMGAPLSLVAPAREMSMMVGALFGMLILGERVTACGWWAARF